MIQATRWKGVFVKTGFFYKAGAHERRRARAFSLETDYLQTGLGFRRGQDEGNQVIHDLRPVWWSSARRPVRSRRTIALPACDAPIQWYERSPDGRINQWAIPFRVAAGKGAGKAVEEAFAELDRAEELSPVQAASKLRPIDPDTLRQSEPLLKVEHPYKHARVSIRSGRSPARRFG